MEGPRKIKGGTAWWLSNSISKYVPEGTQNTNSKEHQQPYVYWSIIYNHQGLEAAHVSVNRWVDETTTGHLSGGILLGCKKEESFTLCDSMDGTGEHYAKWNKPVRERQIPYGFIYMRNLVNKQI